MSDSVTVTPVAEMPLAENRDQAPPEAYRPAAAWLSVAVLMLFLLCSITDRQVIALMVDPIKHDLGLSDTQLGLLQGLAFALLYAIAGIPVGWAVDRFPRRIVVFLGILVWSLSAASCGLARNFWQLFAGRTFVGIGEASMGPAAVSLISDLFPRDKVATPLGVYSAGYYLGAGFSLAVGGWIVGMLLGEPNVTLPLVGTVTGWQAVFIATGVPGLFLAPAAFLIHDPRRRTRAAPESGFAVFLRTRWKIVSLAIAAFSVANFVNYAASAWTPAYFMRVFGWHAKDIGWTYGLVVAISGGVGALGGGIVMDRVFKRGYRDACFLVSGIASLGALPFLLTAYLVASPYIALVLLCLGMTMSGIISAGCYVTWQHIAPPAFRGRLTALYILVASIAGAGLGPLTVGALTDHLLRDEKQVGTSIAITIALSFPVMAGLFFAGRRAMRALPD